MPADPIRSTTSHSDALGRSVGIARAAGRTEVDPSLLALARTIALRLDAEADAMPVSALSSLARAQLAVLTKLTAPVPVPAGDPVEPPVELRGLEVIYRDAAAPPPDAA